MNNRGIFGAYNGMLNVASRRESSAQAPRPAAGKTGGFAARLFGRR